MTQAIQPANNINTKAHTPARADGAQALPKGTRTFDLFLGDAVFKEAINERPEEPDRAEETRSKPEPSAEEEEAARAEGDESAEDTEGAGEGSQDAGAETSAAVQEQPAETDHTAEPDHAETGDGAEALPIEGARTEGAETRQAEVTRGGVQLRREAQLSARAIRAELTHAADVDLASINARELASRGNARSEQGEPAPQPRHDTNAEPQVRRGEAVPKGIANPTPPPSTGLSQAQPEVAAVPKAPAQATDAAAASVPGSVRAPAEAVTKATNTGTSRFPVGTTGAASAVGAVSGTPAAGQTQATTPGVARAVEGVRSSGATTARPAPRGSGAPAPGQANQAPTLATVQRGLASVLKAGGGTVSLKLTPEALGEVKVELSVKQGVANARLEASSESARRLLTENLSTLREALEAKGVRVEKLSVEVRSGHETPPEAARGERPGTDAGRAHQGASPDDGSRGAGSETGAGQDGRAAEDHAARRHASHASAPRSGEGAHGSEHPDGAEDEPGPIGADPARTPNAETWVGLDTVA